jgi:multiple sugar transport system ATP-binding protein
MLQIGELLDRKPSQLSGGQRQRVAMGRALARDPAIFLFDEPLSNLDAKLRVEMRTEIKLLHQRIKTTIVYVTHDQIEAMTLADRIAIMKDGAIQQFDTPQQIYDNPANLFVAGFMGSPSMNFIPCRIVQNENRPGVYWETGDGKIFFLPVDRLHLPLDAWIDHEVILGIRPEQISNGFPDQDQNYHIHEIESPVGVVEPTGSDTLVFVTINGKTVTCRCNPKAAKRPGESMRLMVDMSRAILFHPASGRRIAG